MPVQSMPPHRRSSVRKARLEDLAAIKKWLKEEEAQGVHGNFLCNWPVIEQSHRDGGLFVYIEGMSQLPIAFQSGGLLRPGILQVRSQYRTHGIGRKMVEHCVGVAKKKGEHLLYIQCKPATSIPFWQRMGFTLIPDSAGGNYAWMSLPKSLSLPAGGRSQRVIVRFYPERKKWGEDVPSYEEHFPEAKLVHDKAIAFGHRVLFHERQFGSGRDVVVGIEVEGESRYLDKAKYPEARRVGIQRCMNGWYLDGIVL